MSPRNPWFSKLSMEEKGKALNIETYEEEEDLQALIAEVEEEEDVTQNIVTMTFSNQCESITTHTVLL